MKYRIYLSQPHLNGTEMNYVKSAFDSNYLTFFGENIDAFEAGIARYVGASAALATSSGTSAIHLALRYMGVGRGDMVFCSSLTFAASANPIVYQGGIPVFIDSEPNSWNMSPVALKKAFQWASELGKLPKAVIIVDLYGQAADYDALLPICREYGVPVLEDSTEALGASYNNIKCGLFGKYGIYSFTSNKIITTSGGGMVVSYDTEGIKKMRYWASQAREPLPYYQHEEIGYNYRLSNVSAGIGRGQLATLDERVRKKREIYEKYKQAFKDLPVKMMPMLGYSSCWLSAMTFEKPEINVLDVIKELDKHGIEARMVWKPMHLQPIYKDCKYFKHSEDISRQIFERGICLPSATVMKDEEQQEVIEIIKKFVLEH